MSFSLGLSNITLYKVVGDYTYLAANRYVTWFIYCTFCVSRHKPVKASKRLLCVTWNNNCIHESGFGSDELHVNNKLCAYTRGKSLSPVAYLSSSIHSQPTLKRFSLCLRRRKQGVVNKTGHSTCIIQGFKTFHVHHCLGGHRFFPPAVNRFAFKVLFCMPITDTQKKTRLTHFPSHRKFEIIIRMIYKELYTYLGLFMTIEGCFHGSIQGQDVRNTEIEFAVKKNSDRHNTFPYEPYVVYLFAVSYKH